jgi:hypothetical protein
LRALLDCEGLDGKQQASKVRVLGSSGMSKSSYVWNKLGSRSKELRISGSKAPPAQMISASSKAGFSKWSRYKEHCQMQVLFDVKKHLSISRRAQLPSNQISRKPPVTLEDYVNQTKLMELLR